jgi:hypothetical protein
LLKYLVPPSPSPAIVAIAEKATSVDRAGRYSSVTAFLVDVDRFEQGLAVEAWSEPIWHRLQRFASRNAVLLWLLAAYTVVKFLLFFWRKP